ncbi:MAG: stage III sporulation protein AE [Lachnospira sp.]|nr:stage III sporulation protein AE [Lachnospira sp.]
MLKLVSRIVLTLLLFLAYILVFTDYTEASEKDYTSESDYEQIEKVLKDYGWQGESFEELVMSVAEGEIFSDYNLVSTISQTIIENRTVIIQILLLAISTMFLSVLDKNASDAAMLFVSFIMITLLIAVYINAAKTGSRCVQMAVDIYRALCPVFFPAVSYSCGTGSAAAYYEIILFLMYLVNVFVKNILFKCNYAYMFLGILDTFGEKEKFGKMCQLIKNIIKISVKGMLMFFLGLNGIKSLIIPFGDSMKMSVLFKAVSMIPGLGNSASTVSKTIVGSAVLIKNSIGVAAVIVMLVIIGIPLFKLVVMALVYQFLGAILEPVADKRIVKAVLVLSGSLENMIYMIAVTVVLMCLTLAIICFATNINLYSI